MAIQQCTNCHTRPHRTGNTYHHDDPNRDTDADIAFECYRFLPQSDADRRQMVWRCQPRRIGGL